MNFEFKSETASVDTETFYNKKDYSVGDLGLYGYTHDPRFDCYLVSVASRDFEYVGHPKDMPWEKIAGKEWVSHNKGFDHAVITRMQELGTIPTVAPSRWHCSANLCVYNQLPRDLKGAVLAAFGETISKDVRDKEMNGKHWHEFTPDTQQRVLAYALDDPRWCLALWEKFSPEWPETERLLSELTYRQGSRGFYVDREGVDNDIRLLEKVKFEAVQRIPWRDNYAILSHVGLAEQCRMVGITPPASLAMNDEACAAWEDQYGSTYPWVAAMRDYRRTNALLEKFKTLRERIMPNGRMSYSLYYFGGHTGRWSGAGGFNMQNMPREAFRFDKNFNIISDPEKLNETKHADTPPEYLLGSVDMRGKFIAAPGKKLLVADYAQIEARITPWLAGDTETLALARKGISVYEGHARKSMGWTGGPLKKEDPKLYLLAKIRVLGLGFGCGHEKFLVIGKQWLPEDVFEAIFLCPVSAENELKYIDYRRRMAERSEDSAAWKRWLTMWKKKSDKERWGLVNSWLQVSSFRATNPKIVALWKKLDQGLKSSIGGTYEVELPSGRVMRYFNVNDTEGSIQARTTRGGHFSYFYGGKVCENIVQATARDVFGDAKLRVDQEMPVIMDTHDEIISEVDEAFNGQRLVEIMTQPPSWASSLPLGVELTETKVYLK